MKAVYRRRVARQRQVLQRLQRHQVAEPQDESELPQATFAARTSLTSPDALHPADVLALQQTIGNRAVQRLLANPADGVTRIQRDDDPLPQADLGPKSRSRMYGLDWDSKHSEINRINADDTLRMIFEQHLLMQIEHFFADTLQECTTLEEARARIAELIAEEEEDGVCTEEGERLRANFNKAVLFAVVATLDVEDSSRYDPSERTYCNIYTYDVISAMGGYLPRVWWNDDSITKLRAGETVVPVLNYPEKASNPNTVHEMNANALTQWMATYGGDFGWRKAGDMNEAQQAANNGGLVIILAANKQADESGHVTVVMPETEGHEAARDADKNVQRPMHSQAGRTNVEYGTSASQWWKNSSHKDGAAWIFEGERSSPLLAPETLAPEPESVP